MGVSKCNVGLVWSLLLAAILTIVPRYWEVHLESLPVLGAPVVPSTEVLEGTIQKNSTLVATLVDYEIPYAVASRIADLIRPVFDVRKLRIGNLFKIERERADRSLRAFEYKIDDERVLKVEKAANSFAARVERLPLEVNRRTMTAEIQSTLWGALDGVPKGEALAVALADVFAWDVDFNADIQKGDRIHVVIDEYRDQGRTVKYGNILAARLENGGRRYEAFQFGDGYYDAKGNALKRDMLKSPVKFTRVSSGFSYRRFHPILGTNRSHLAVDYAAPAGTPIQAIANGRVTFSGANGGLGRYVEIRHVNGLATGYGHMSRIASAARSGTAVKQGDVIGYVGATGLATGAHLHFTMKRHGTPINPLRMRSEPAKPIDSKRKPSYLTHIAPFQAQLETALASR